MNGTPIALPVAFGQSLVRSFVRASLIALYLTVAFAAWPVFAADGELARTAPNHDAQGAVAALGITLPTVGTAFARWFREELP